LQYYYASGDFTNQNTNSLTTTKSLIITSDNAIDWNTKKGWYLPLYNNYPRPARVISSPYIVNNLVYFNTITPDFPACGEGKLWGTTQALQTCTGARPNTGVFDTNNDGIVDNNDKYNLWDSGNMVNVTGVNIQDQQRIFDPSIWINPKALTCKDSSCTKTSSTILMGNLGIAQPNSSPQRITWQEIKQP
jgi:hypothetical protein